MVNSSVIDILMMVGGDIRNVREGTTAQRTLMMTATPLGNTAVTGEKILSLTCT